MGRLPAHSDPSLLDLPLGDKMLKYRYLDPGLFIDLCPLPSDQLGVEMGESRPHCTYS
jgi:hypothetical protein